MRCYHCKKEINTDGKEVNFCPFCGKNPNGETPPHNARSEYGQDNKTVYADDVSTANPQRQAEPPAQNNNEPFMENQSGWSPVPPVPPYGQPMPYDQPNNSRKNTPVIVLIAVVSALLVTAIIFAIVLFLNKSDDDKKSSSAAEASAQATSVSEATTVKPAEETTVKPVEETTEEPEEETTEKPTEKPTETPTAKPVIDTPAPPDATYFSDATASSQLEDQTDSETKLTYNYDASNVLSRDTTCWCEGADGTGIGEWIRLDLPGTRRLRGIGIINGYAGNKKQYENNSKPTRIQLEFSNGETITSPLYVMSYQESRSLQKIDFSSVFDDGYVDTDYVIITILDASDAFYDDTCITYVEPY